ncbi:uncharacterized protein LOC128243775 [Mya arenaria]|uniref:uncharacterized protein LOC128243775 n=1 Tax=Mya arenaria TaxID=6604 RepID=UPI0022E5E301|nr:uncharacterized protein LOC128243775 [Mya arenaria]
MAANNEKKRNPNFSKEECLLICKLMGEESGHGMSKHALYKKGYTSRITSETKRKMWEAVERSFNVQSTGIHRTVDLLTKKWDNLTQVHRPKFMDYKRQLHLTDLTNAVIDVIGRDGCAMDGIGGSEEFDSTCIQESQSRSDVGLNSQPVYQFVNDYTTYQPVLEADEVPATFHLSRPEASTTSKVFTTSTSCNRCCCQECKAIRQLQKRKLELEVAILAKQLKKEQ